MELVVRIKANGSPTFKEFVTEQPALSITVTAYDPAERLEIEFPTPALLQVMVKGAVPELTAAVAVPSAPPKQETGVEESATTGLEVPPTTAVSVLLQPLASVTVT
jgi:hypothetical protein